MSSIVVLTAHERFVLSNTAEFAINLVEDLLRLAHRTSEDRHRAAGMAVAVAHLCDGIDTGELDMDAPGVRDWLAYDRDQTAQSLPGDAEWLRQIRNGEPSARRYYEDVPDLEQRVEAQVNELLDQFAVYDRVLAREVTA